MTVSLRKTRSSASNAVCREMHYVCIVLSRRESVGPRHSLIRARASISSSGNLDLHGSGERSWKTYTAWHYEFLVAFEPLCPALFHPFSLLKSANSGRWKEINRECQKRRRRGRGGEKERESEIDGGTVYRVLISWKERGTIRRGRFYSFWKNHPSSLPLFDNDRIIGTESEWFFFFFLDFWS